MIEQNLRNFKLKSRTAYQKLAEEEQTLMMEISAASDKFEAWENEEPTSDLISAIKRSRPPKGRPPAMRVPQSGAPRNA